jgi:hypothetical protein
MAELAQKIFIVTGAGGAIAGAAIARGNPVLGAILGGALGAGGGYLLGVEMDRAHRRDLTGAQTSIQNAQSNPATADQARGAQTADINGDGFVTLDEVIALKKAGFSDEEMLQKLRATNQVFALTQEQKNELTRAGVSRRVIDDMERINAEQRDQLMSAGGGRQPQ